MLAARAVFAHSPGAPDPWRLEGVRAAYCVRFLIRPNILPYVVPDGITPLQATQVPRLDPVLRLAVAERPDSFGTFTPSRVCTVHFEAASLGGERVEADRHSVLSVVVWSVTALADSAGRRVERDAAIDVRANDGDLADALRDAGIRAGRIWTRVGVLSDSTREEASLRLGATNLVWEGRLGTDPSAGLEPIVWSWWAQGYRGGSGTVRIELRPTSSRAMIGSLRVTGEDDFAESLMASPVRFAGPIHIGGSAEMTVSR